MTTLKTSIRGIAVTRANKQKVKINTLPRRQEKKKKKKGERNKKSRRNECSRKSNNVDRILNRNPTQFYRSLVPFGTSPWAC